MTQSSTEQDTGSEAPGKPRRRRIRRLDPLANRATDLLFEKIFWVRKGKKALRVSTELLLLRRKFNQAMEGKPEALKAMLKIVLENEKAKRAQQEAYVNYPSVDCVDPANADAALLILGLATIDRRDLSALQRMDRSKARRWALVLEPDLVAAALARPDASRLNRAQASAVQRHTRDEGTPPVQEEELEGALLYDAAVLPRDPKSTWFKPNQSGNPKGRPPKVRFNLPFDGFLEEVVVLPVEGAMREMTRADALLFQMMKKGLEGNERLEAMIWKLVVAERLQRHKSPRLEPVTETRI